MVETNIEIKVEEEFPAGINVVKEIEVHYDDMPKEESSSVYNKEYEERPDEATGNKEIEYTNTDCCLRKHRILCTNLLSEVAC